MAEQRLIKIVRGAVEILIDRKVSEPLGYHHFMNLPGVCFGGDVMDQ